MFLPYSLILIFSLLVPLQCATPINKQPSDDIIKQTCQKCAEMRSYNFNYNFCYSSLATVPLSKATNLAGLGVVAMDLALQNATNAVSFIRSMLDNRNASDSCCNSCLESCHELYSGISTVLEGCVSEFLSMQFDHVYLWISTVMQTPGICDASFREREEESPLTMENYSLSQLSGIVLCIIDLISPALKVTPSLITWV